MKTGHPKNAPPRGGVRPLVAVMALLGLGLSAMVLWSTLGGVDETAGGGAEEHAAVAGAGGAANAAPPAEAPSANAKEPGPARRRPELLLISTAEAREPADSTATFRLLASGKLRAVRAGSEVADGSVLEWVKAGHAGLRMGDDRWTLALSADPPPIAPQEDPPGDDETAQLRPPGSHTVEEAHGNRHLLDVFREEPGAVNEVNLLSEATVSFRFDEENGDILGMKLDAVAPDGVYARLGIRSGDVMLAVNGIEIDGPEAAESVLAEIQEASVIRILLERAERQEEVVVERIATEGPRAEEGAG